MLKIVPQALVAFVLSSPALAQSLKNVRPGLLCEKPDALAALTLPNGSNRLHSAGARPGDADLMTRGGCIDIPGGAVVTLQIRRRLTSIVTFKHKTFVTPNIDYAEATADAAATVTETSGAAAPPPAPPVASEEPAVSTPDVSGVRLGVSISEAEAILGPDYKYSTPSTFVPTVPGIELVTGSKTEPLDPSGNPTAQDEYRLMTFHSKLLLITHQQSFAEGSMPNRQTLHQALEKKYGPLSYEYTTGGSGSPDSQTRWMYLSGNRLLASSNFKAVQDARMGCELYTGVGIVDISALNVCVAAGIYSPTPNNRPNPALVSSFDLTLIDQRAIFAFLANAKAEQAAKDKAVIEQSKSNEPKL